MIFRQFPNPVALQKRPRIAITYDIITPESAEESDVAESGWIDEDGVEIEPDEDESLAEAAARFLIDEGSIEASSSFFHPGIWYLTEYETKNYRTGEEEQRHFHLRDFNDQEQHEVYEEFKRLRRRR